MQRRTISCSCGYDDAVVHGAVLFQSTSQAGNTGSLLADGNVNTNYVLAFLIDDGIDSDGALAGTTVAND